MHEEDDVYILWWPPRLRMAWTKQRCRPDVHLRRRTLDLLYCLTPPAPPPLSFPSLVALSMVIELEASKIDNTNRHGSKEKPRAPLASYLYFCIHRSNSTPLTVDRAT
jgi:hypothetical protein